jgi:hypothetical protein
VSLGLTVPGRATTFSSPTSAKGRKLRYTITFSGDPEEVQVTISNHVTYDDVRSYLQDLLGDPRWRPGMDLLVDVGAADVADLTSTDIMRFAELFAEHGTQMGGGRHAIVASDPVRFGLARMWGTYAESSGAAFTSAVFDSVERAREWLRSGSTS